MHDFVLIREYRPKDKAQCEDLVKSYLMQCSREAFMTVLFKEVRCSVMCPTIFRKLNYPFYHPQITLQLIILICALLFIFFGMPPMACLCVIPVVLLGIFLSVYSAYYGKAVDLCNVRGSPLIIPNETLTHFPVHSLQDRPKMCWVAELHYRGIDPPKNVTEVYSGISEQNMLNMEANLCQKAIIGTGAVKLHHSIENSALLYRVAFSNDGYFQSAGEPLLRQILQFCVRQEYHNLEAVARECDDEFKELLIRSGYVNFVFLPGRLLD